MTTKTKASAKKTAASTSGGESKRGRAVMVKPKKGGAEEKRQDVIQNLCFVQGKSRSAALKHLKENFVNADGSEITCPYQIVFAATKKEIEAKWEKDTGKKSKMPTQQREAEAA